MKANLHCECQSRMTVVDGVAFCKNGAYKHFAVEFKAPNSAPLRRYARKVLKA